MSRLVALPATIPQFLEPHEPRLIDSRPFVTLTYAQSIDAKIASRPGARTVISHAETKTMTHYLRSLHDGILIGVGTALADDPGLNCRYNNNVLNEERSTPRPIIIDPWFKWSYEGSKLESLVKRGEGKEPWVVVCDQVEEKEKIDYLLKNGGEVIVLELNNGRFNWDCILTELKAMGIDSVMVEGGSSIINQLLMEPKLVDSLIITIGSTFLGQDGVSVSPPETVKLTNVDWWHGETDSVLTANISTR